MDGVVRADLQAAGDAMRAELMQGLPSQRGMLKKLGGFSLGLEFLKAVVDRWCELRGPTMEYYGSIRHAEQTPRRPKGVLLLDETSILEAPVRHERIESPYAFVLTTHARSEVFACASEPEFHAWVGAIDGVLKTLRRFPAVGPGRPTPPLPSAGVSGGAAASSPVRALPTAAAALPVMHPTTPAGATTGGYPPYGAAHATPAAAAPPPLSSLHAAPASSTGGGGGTGGGPGNPFASATSATPAAAVVSPGNPFAPPPAAASAAVAAAGGGGGGGVASGGMYDVDLASGVDEYAGASV